MNIFKFNFKQTTHLIEGKEYQIKPIYIDLILSFIIDRVIYSEESSNHYTEIPSVSFKKLYDNYWIYMGYLIDKNIIERKPYSVKNHQCYGYRFTYDFMKSVIIYDIELSDPYKRTNEIKEIPLDDQVVLNYQTIQHLKSDFLSAEVDLSYIEKIKYENSPYIDSKKYFYNMIQLYKWNKGGEYLYFDLKSNRLYTNFTNLSSHYRLNNVRLNGEKLVEIDISSSFPLMLGVLCTRINPEIVNDYDFKQYCTSIKNKTFYQDLTDSLNRTKDCNSSKGSDINSTSKRTFTKDIVKVLFQLLINGKNNSIPYIEGYSNSYIKEQFYLKYPCIYEIIEQVKSNNELLYYKLSKIETEFVFGIIEDLYNKIPLIQILTVHDALYISKSFEIEAKEIWDNHMQYLLNTLPDNLNEEIVDNIKLEDFGIYEEPDGPLSKKRYLSQANIDFLNEVDDEDEDDDEDDDFWK